MDLNHRAQQAVNEISKIVDSSFSEEQRRAIKLVIEDIAIEAMRECAATCGHAASACCSEDEDLAHKIAREVRQAQEALIANLSSLR